MKRADSMCRPFVLARWLWQAWHKALVHTRDRQEGHGGLHSTHRGWPHRGLRLERGAQFGQQHWGRRRWQRRRWLNGRVWHLLPADLHPVLQRHVGGSGLRQLPVRCQLKLLSRWHCSGQLQPGVLLLQDVDDVGVRVRQLLLRTLARSSYPRSARKQLVLNGYLADEPRRDTRDQRGVMMGYGKLLRRGGVCYYDIQKESTTKSNVAQREGGREREREREREALKQARGDASGGQRRGGVPP